MVEWPTENTEVGKGGVGERGWGRVGDLALPFGVGFVAFCGFGPLGEGESVNFGVVADVDGQLGVKVKAFDRGGVGRGQGEGAEFAGESPGLGGIADGRFDDDGGKLVRGAAETDEGAARGAGVDAEDLFAGFGVKNTLGGGDAFGFAAAEPEAAVGVEVTAVAEAVKDGGFAAGLRAES